MSRYRFIEAEKVEERSVNRACAVLEVSRAAYYEWRKQEPSARPQQDREPAEKVKAIFCRSGRTYGAPRVHRELGRQGLRCSRKRVAMLIGELDLVGSTARSADSPLFSRMRPPVPYAWGPRRSWTQGEGAGRYSSRVNSVVRTQT